MEFVEAHETGKADTVSAIKRRRRRLRGRERDLCHEFEKPDWFFYRLR